MSEHFICKMCGESVLPHAINMGGVYHFHCLNCGLIPLNSVASTDYSFEDLMGIITAVRDYGYGSENEVTDGDAWAHLVLWRYRHTNWDGGCNE